MGSFGVRRLAVVFKIVKKLKMYRINPSEADKLVYEAEKKLALNTGLLKFFFGGPKKVDDAIEYYKRAASLYKMDRSWEEAGSTFAKCASLAESIKYKHQAALDYEQAANCYKKINYEEAEMCFLKAIDIHLGLGKFATAAKVHEVIAAMYEVDNTQTDKIIHYYEQASEYYRGEESAASANRCLLKVAYYSAEAEKYERAIVIYERIAMASMTNNLLKYSAKDYFFRATICALCINVSEARSNIEKYTKLYPAFADCREYKFCMQLIDAIEEQNVDTLTDVVKEYDSTKILDRWLTSLLLRIKRKMGSDPDLR